MAKTKKLNENDYLFISALLRAREQKLLNAERAERMLAAGSWAGAAKVLEECGYPDVGAGSGKELEKVLSERRDGVFAELARLAPGDGIVDAFRMKYDYHNAKVIVKAEALSQDGSRLLSASGRVPADKLRDAFVRRDDAGVPKPLYAAMQEAKTALARTGDPQRADFLLDAAYVGEFLAAAEATGSGFLAGYARLFADQVNLRSAVRARRMEKNADFLRSALVPGGSVEPARIAEAIGASLPVAPLFEGTPLREAALVGDDLKGGLMTKFERLCDDALTGYCAGARGVAFGNEVLVAYLCAVENELSAVRIIMTGLRTGLGADVIRSRLRRFCL